ncbi:hypothetical protein RJ639_021389, partial [Escallonia herrerae]
GLVPAYGAYAFNGTEPQHVPACLLFKLKTIEIRHFDARMKTAQLMFTEYLLMNAKVLETMQILCAEDLGSSMRKELLKLPRDYHYVVNLVVVAAAAVAAAAVSVPRPPSKPKRICPDEDRISKLPDAILTHLLSFLPENYAVRTGLLSTRWKYIWALLPTLLFKMPVANATAGADAKRPFSWTS